MKNNVFSQNDFKLFQIVLDPKQSIFNIMNEFFELSNSFSINLQSINSLVKQYIFSNMALPIFLDNFENEIRLVDNKFVLALWEIETQKKNAFLNYVDENPKNFRKCLINFGDFYEESFTLSSLPLFKSHFNNNLFLDFCFSYFDYSENVPAPISFELGIFNIAEPQRINIIKIDLLTNINSINVSIKTANDHFYKVIKKFKVDQSSLYGFKILNKNNILYFIFYNTGKNYSAIKLHDSNEMYLERRLRFFFKFNKINQGNGFIKLMKFSASRFEIN